MGYVARNAVTTRLPNFLSGDKNMLPGARCIPGLPMQLARLEQFCRSSHLTLTGLGPPHYRRPANHHQICVHAAPCEHFLTNTSVDASSDRFASHAMQRSRCPGERQASAEEAGERRWLCGIGAGRGEGVHPRVEALSQWHPCFPSVPRMHHSYSSSFALRVWHEHCYTNDNLLPDFDMMVRISH